MSLTSVRDDEVDEDEMVDEDEGVGDGGTRGSADDVVECEDAVVADAL